MAPVPAPTQPSFTASAVAAAAAKLVESFLYGVKPGDPRVLAGAALLWMGLLSAYDIRERRLIRRECRAAGLPVVSVACVALGLIDFNPSVQRFHLERCKKYLDLAYELPDGAARFRVNVLWQHRGMGAVLRVIPTKILTMDQLGLPPGVRQIAETRRGMVLVTGPTGSGKSTTLAAIIDHINETREAHIITIEDPLEFVHPNKKCLISQREVKSHTKSFSSALKMAARDNANQS